MALGIYEEEDIRALAEEIRDHGGNGYMTVKQMKDEIANVYYHGESNGHSDGYIVGFENGKEEGRTEGLEEGKAIGYTEGKTDGIEQGRKSQYDEFWDGFQNYGQKTSYQNAFEQSAIEYIRPKYKIIPTGSTGVSCMFMSAKVKKIEAKYFDFSQVPIENYTARGLNYTFSSCTNLEEIEDIGLSPSYAFTYTFAWCGKLHTIAKITFAENTIITHVFDSLHSLVNLTIGGTIGQNGFNVQWSTKLSKASITSIINALSTTTSGLTVTLSKTAVNNAFNGGSTGDEWLNLVATKNNWTISLV